MPKKKKYSEDVVRDEFKKWGFPEPVFEYKFHPERKWRVDIVLLDESEGIKIAIEIEGLNGRHQRTAGFISDMLKYNSLVCMGWMLLRFTFDDMLMEENLEKVKTCLEFSKACNGE